MQSRFVASVFTFAFCWLTAAPSFACEAGREVWANDKDGFRTVIYFPDKNPTNGRLIVEGWAGKQIRWRIKAGHGCSNGVVICSADIPLSNGKFMDASFEAVYENDEPKYLVSTQLLQTSFLAQTRVEAPQIVASWFASPPPETQKPFITLPSVYRLIGCQNGNELSAGLTIGERNLSDLLGDWQGVGEGNIIATIQKLPGKPIRLEANVVTSMPGCIGDVTAQGPVSGPQIVLKSEEQNTECRLSIEMVGRKALRITELEGCLYFHGAACGFTGNLLRQSAQ
jgi:hypothetical protein